MTIKRYATLAVLTDLPKELDVGQTVIVKFPRGRTLANRLWRKYGPGTCTVKRIEDGMWSCSRHAESCKPTDERW